MNSATFQHSTSSHSSPIHQSSSSPPKQSHVTPVFSQTPTAGHLRLAVYIGGPKNVTVNQNGQSHNSDIYPPLRRLQINVPRKLPPSSERSVSSSLHYSVENPPSFALETNPVKKLHQDFDLSPDYEIGSRKPKRTVNEYIQKSDSSSHSSSRKSSFSHLVILLFVFINL